MCTLYSSKKAEAAFSEKKFRIGLMLAQARGAIASSGAIVNFLFVLLLYLQWLYVLGAEAAS